MGHVSFFSCLYFHSASCSDEFLQYYVSLCTRAPRHGLVCSPRSRQMATTREKLRLDVPGREIDKLITSPASKNHQGARLARQPHVPILSPSRRSSPPPLPFCRIGKRPRRPRLAPFWKIRWRGSNGAGCPRVKEEGKIQPRGAPAVCGCGLGKSRREAWVGCEKGAQRVPCGMEVWVLTMRVPCQSMWCTGANETSCDRWVWLVRGCV